jgi:hypothetical protein
MKPEPCNQIDVPVKGDVKKHIALRKKRADAPFAKDFEAG